MTCATQLYERATQVFQTRPIPAPHDITVKWDATVPCDDADIQSALKGKAWTDISPEVIRDLEMGHGLFTRVKKPYFYYILPSILHSIVVLKEESDAMLDSFLDIISEKEGFSAESIDFLKFFYSLPSPQKDAVIEYFKYYSTIWPQSVTIRDVLNKLRKSRARKRDKYI